MSGSESIAGFSPPEVALLAVSLALHTMACVLGVATARAHAALLRSEGGARSGLRSARFQRLQFLFLFSPFAFPAAFALANGFGRSPGDPLVLSLGDRPALFAILALGVPHLLVFAGVVALQLRNARSHLADGSAPTSRAQTLSAVAIWGSTVALALWLDLAAASPLSLRRTAPVALPVVGVAIVAGAVLARRGSGIRPGRRFELDPSPLRDEVASIARLTGVELASIRMEPARVGKAAPSAAARAARIGVWWKFFDPLAPILPLDFASGLDPDALTAGLASRYSTAEIRLGASRALRRCFGTPGRSLLSIYSALLLAVVPLGAAYVGLANPRAVVLCVLAWLAALGAGGIALAVRTARRSRGLRTASSVERCHAVWRDASPSARREPEDFLRALGRFNRALNPSLKAETVFAFYMGFEGIAAYIAAMGDAEAERVRRAIAQDFGLAPETGDAPPANAAPDRAE